MENTTTTGSEKMDSFLRQHINRQLLKYEAGSAIFCPACQNIMDCRKTVVATIHRHLDGHDDECVAKYVMCAKCWKTRGPKAQEAFDRVSTAHPELNARFEVVTWK